MSETTSRRWNLGAVIAAVSALCAIWWIGLFTVLGWLLDALTR